MSDLYEIKMRKHRKEFDALTEYIEITDKISGNMMFPTIDEILDSLSDKEILNLLVKIQNKRAYKTAVIE